MNTIERKLKARVALYQRKVEEEAEEHIVRLNESRSAIEKIMAECENFLKTSHVISISKGRSTMLNRLHCHSTDNINFSECDMLQGLCWQYTYHVPLLEYANLQNEQIFIC